MLHGKSYGQGRVVVFLHGFLLDSKGWEFFRPDETRYQSVFIDLPGHGDSKSFLPDSYGMECYAQAVSDFLVKQGIHTYDLVGHSMGGYIGLRLMQLETPPERLILFHSNHWADGEERRKNRDRVGEVVRTNKSLFLRESIPLLFDQAELHTTQIKSIVERAMTMSPEAIIHSAQSMKIRPDSADVVSKFAERCWLIQGERDKLIPLNESLEAWAGLPNQFIRIPNCGHMGHLEQPEECMLQIEQILKQKTEN